MTGLVDHPCDAPGCDQRGIYGYTAPHGYTPPKRPLWACSAHQEWAEARWREKYHGVSR